MFIFIHAGQCGVQIGAELWTKLTIPDNQCNYLMVDSEPKVVNALKLGKERDNVIHDRRGCGNNWGCGFSSDLTTKVMQRIRQLAENSDSGFMGVVLFHSLAGGTGSGVTSKLLEQLRTCYSNQYLINVSVKPFTTGELPLQYYNSALALSWLQEYSDGVLLIDNEATLNHHSSIVTLSDMNSVIAQSLTNCLQPLEPR